MTEREREQLLDEVYGPGNRRRFAAERELCSLSVRGALDLDAWGRVEVNH